MKSGGRLQGAVEESRGGQERRGQHLVRTAENEAGSTELQVEVRMMHPEGRPEEGPVGHPLRQARGLMAP